MAQERRRETERSDRLFDDPWAQHMVAAGRTQLLDSADWLTADVTPRDAAPGMADYVPFRTRWIDDRLLAHVHAQAATVQIVLLGCGLDTRLLRLSWPQAVTVYLLDQPALLRCAETFLVAEATTARGVPVASDLTADWPADLRHRGFVPGVTTVWVLEGVLMYLTEPQAAQVLTQARILSGPGSVVLADLAHPHVHHNALFAPGRQALAENDSPFGTTTAEPHAFYNAAGWHSHPVDVHALAESYHRSLPPALDPDAVDGPSFWFTEAWIS